MESYGLYNDEYNSATKDINPEYSLEGLMLKLQYSGHLICGGQYCSMALLFFSCSSVSDCL